MLDFMLQSSSARSLYHNHASKLAIIDFHNHLSPKAVADNKYNYNITELWLSTDHYKWRAMRAAGISEHYITGEASNSQKFLKWAETVPQTLRNPLYHWTMLELKQYFDIDTPLCPETADNIYQHCNKLLSTPDYSICNLLAKKNVEVICTTDDPSDSLEHHQRFADNPHAKFKMLPTWRPDKLLAIENLAQFNLYILQLGQSANTDITSLSKLFSAIKKRQLFFHNMGCRLSDHGLDTFYGSQCTEEELSSLFKKLLCSKPLTAEETQKYRSGMVKHLATINHDMGWRQQFHVGPLRNNRTKLYTQLGADTGCDSINDKQIAQQLSSFLDNLDSTDHLAPTILYNLNPKDGEVMAAMAANFNNGTTPGKMQYGAAWWFLDHLSGMERQIDIVSNYGLLSQFVGMVTDSRSFLSFSRHDYFRRLLCNILGRELDNGLIPAAAYNQTAKIVEDICYYNALRYFNF